VEELYKEYNLRLDAKKLGKEYTQTETTNFQDKVKRFKSQYKRHN
jgi:hypothetical protein